MTLRAKNPGKTNVPAKVLRHNNHVFGRIFKANFNCNGLMSLEKFNDLPDARKLAFFKAKRGIQHVGKMADDDYPYSEDHTPAMKQYQKDCCYYVQEMKKILDKCDHIE